jgi:hypothetical protein
MPGNRNWPVGDFAGDAWEAVKKLKRSMVHRIQKGVIDADHPF